MLCIDDVEIDCVLFDLDGTLVHTHIDFNLMRTEIRRMAGEAGVDPQLLDGKEVLEMVATAAQAAGPRGDQLRLAMWKRLEEIEVDGARDAWAIPGAMDLLNHLRQAGVKIGVVTRNCRKVSVEVMKTFQLNADVLLTRDDVQRPKPDPAHLLDAMKSLSVLPDSTVMVGDHWLDVRAGQEAGCAKTVGVLGNRDRSYFDPCPPDYIVKDLTETDFLSF